MFEEFYAMYAPEEQEVYVLIRRALGAGYYAKGDFWDMTVLALGMFFPEKNVLDTREARIEWPMTEEEKTRGKGWHRFAANTIYRLKVRRLLDRFAPPHIKPEKMNTWMVVDVLEEKASCPPLQRLLDFYEKPVVIEDDVLGTLTLNRDIELFEGRVCWCGTKAMLFLEVDAQKKGSWTRARNAMKKMLLRSRHWDAQMRTLAAKELTALANQWRQEDEATRKLPAITEKDFMQRIHLSRISMTSGGSFSFTFDDDDMFWGHFVVVYGTLKKGVLRAQMEG